MVDYVGADALARHNDKPLNIIRWSSSGQYDWLVLEPAKRPESSELGRLKSPWGYEPPRIAVGTDDDETTPDTTAVCLCGAIRFSSSAVRPTTERICSSVWQAVTKNRNLAALSSTAG